MSTIKTNVNHGIVDYSQIIEWFQVHTINGATDEKFTVDNIFDFEFTFSFTLDDYFKCAINYISGRGNFNISVKVDDEYIMNYNTRFERHHLPNHLTLIECIAKCVEIIEKVVDYGDY